MQNDYQVQSAILTQNMYNLQSAVNYQVEADYHVQIQSVVNYQVEADTSFVIFYVTSSTLVQEFLNGCRPFIRLDETFVIFYFDREKMKQRGKWFSFGKSPCLLFSMRVFLSFRKYKGERSWVDFVIKNLIERSMKNLKFSCRGSIS